MSDNNINSNKIRRIGVLTSGGDAPGMNAAVRAITRSAISRGVRVMGILKGYRGLIDGELVEYNARSVSNIINRGGTVLYSDRCIEFQTEEGMQKAVDTCREFEIDGIVAIGGDGTFRGATDISRHGILTIGIPGTIDNDITATDYSIGFDTAMNTVIEMVDRLRDTCESHARCNVVEVMGRDAGHIALQCGIAAGAVGIALKELPFDEDECLSRIIEGKKNKKRTFIVIVSEGMGEHYAEDLTKKINAATGIDTRFARLAHVQRGGSPTLRDRFVATVMGNRAVELIMEGRKNLVVCMHEDKIVETDIEYALNLDKRYKNKMTDEQFALLSADDQNSITERIKHKKENFRELYEVSKIMSI
ncbi:MAG: 6-phosphofructokinase [Oscillospiraceae bacterium]|nr:6-phosphofructokinase [Oscillospiraceae bacterium]